VSTPLPAEHRGLPVVHPRSREAWRRWLAAHHRSGSGVWVARARGSADRATISYDEIVEEALCFGWIDSLAGRLDEEHNILKITPRRPGSPWSASNRGRVHRLIETGLMMPAGLDAVERARADGSWTALEAAERLEEPDDLRDALDAEPEARRAWNAFAPSARKSILWWVLSAKRAETRSRRVAEVVSEAAAGRRAQFDRKTPGEGSGAR
jgi:uncharacterized protein YdeI (YjbR/CyaY-like superfamily)